MVEFVFMKKETVFRQYVSKSVDDWVFWMGEGSTPWKLDLPQTFCGCLISFSPVGDEYVTIMI